MFAFDRSSDTGRAPRTAIYLRSYPFDASGMECHRRALEELAFSSGLPEPVMFLDNGLRAGDGLPSRDALLKAVAAGSVDILLVPGLYVFGLDDDEANAVKEELARHGCRLVQLPSRRGRARRDASLTPAA
ncbi:hypothetical protein [Kitasatospora sp. NPDC059327]|uniref:hypothetical protein n=1 Tax=Kitasatospora sp. NPDC059327 TaxID=3346803 RepID=UPI00369070E0